MTNIGVPQNVTDISEHSLDVVLTTGQEGAGQLGCGRLAPLSWTEHSFLGMDS